jgi:hypothetical protein
LSEQVNELESTGAGWCYNSTFTRGRTGEIAENIRSMWMPLPQRYVTEVFQRWDNWFLSHPHLSFLIALMRNPVNSSTLMIRRSTYVGIKYFGDWRTDWDSQVLFRLLLDRVKGRAIPVAGVFYRTHSGQASNKPGYRKDTKEVRECVLGDVLAGDFPAWLKLTVRMTRGWILRKY